MVIDDGAYRKFLFQFLSSRVLIIVILVLRLAAMSDDEESEKCQSSFPRRFPDSPKDRSLLVVDICTHAQDGLGF
jgi:hypothetical protein